MNKDMFMKLVHGASEYDAYFMLKKDDIGVLGFSLIQKCSCDDAFI